MKKPSIAIVLSFTLLIFSALPAHALLASKTDLWDVSEGAIVTGTSGALSGSWSSDARNMFGGAFGSGPPDVLNNTIFQDYNPAIQDYNPAGTVHWVEWKTPSPVTLGSINLVAAHDDGWDGYVNRDISYRGFSEFWFYARNSVASPWTNLAGYITDADHDLQYGGGVNYPLPNYLEFYASVVPSLAQYFRAEFVQYGGVRTGGYPDAQGPRICELDGYAYFPPTGAPEPTTMLLLGLGLMGLAGLRGSRK